MSLRGIFDPMVRAYFKNQSDGGGSNLKYRILSNPKEAVVQTTQAGMVLEKISEYFPFKPDENGLAGFLCMFGTVNHKFVDGTIGNGGTDYFQVQTADGMEMWALAVIETDTPIMIAINQETLDIFSQDPEAAAALPTEPGVWLNTTATTEPVDWVALFYE